MFSRRLEKPSIDCKSARKTRWYDFRHPIVVKAAELTSQEIKVVLEKDVTVPLRLAILISDDVL